MLKSGPSEAESEKPDNVIEIVKADPTPLENSLIMVSRNVMMIMRNRDQRLGFAEGSFYLYQAGYWRAVDTGDQAFQYMLKEATRQAGGLTYAKDYKLIIKHLETDEQFELKLEDFDKEPLVATRHGTVDIRTGDVYGHFPEHMTTRYVDLAYDEDAECPKWLETLDDIMSSYPAALKEEAIELLQEWFGMAMSGMISKATRSMRIGLFLYGQKMTGKSTLLEVLYALLGTDAVCNIAPGQLTKEFGMAPIVGKQAWIADEVDPQVPIDAPRLKQLVTGERMSVPRKYRDNTTIQFNGPIVWAGNVMPKVNEATSAVYDRFVVIELQKQFTGKESEQRFGKGVRPGDYLIENELAGIFNWALAGYRRIWARGYYRKSAMHRGLSNWRNQNDAIYEFLAAHAEPNDQVWTGSNALAHAIVEWARTQRKEDISPRTVQRRIGSTIRDLYPLADKKLCGDHRITGVVGLAVKDSGLKYVEAAKRKFEDEQYLDIVNQKLTFQQATD